MKIIEIINIFETIAPLSYQEHYDNCGLQLGDSNCEVSGILITLDVTEDIVNEAIANNCNLIISHHPVIFGALKKLRGSNYVERIVLQAIKNDIALYAAHTNFDNAFAGVNRKICDTIGLQNCKILSPQKNQLRKLVTFVPKNHIEKVRTAIFEAGAGCIGNYNSVSYNIDGTGTFRGNESSTPFVGKKGELHFENEIRFETIFPSHFQSQVIDSLLHAHPYEEVAYDIYPLENANNQVGAGMIGEFENEMNEKDFLKLLSNQFKTKVIRHTAFLNRPIKIVAVCGGSGHFLLKNAIAAKADVFVSAEFGYHTFFDAENQILITDIGHYESEQFTKNIFYEMLTQKFPTFAIHISEINTNPINYFVE